MEPPGTYKSYFPPALLMGFLERVYIPLLPPKQMADPAPVELTSQIRTWILLPNLFWGGGGEGQLDASKKYLIYIQGHIQKICSRGIQNQPSCGFRACPEHQSVSPGGFTLCSAEVFCVSSKPTHSVFLSPSVKDPTVPTQDGFVPPDQGDSVDNPPFILLMRSQGSNPLLRSIQCLPGFCPRGHINYLAQW